MKKQIIIALLCVMGMTMHAEVTYLTTAEFKAKVMDYTSYSQQTGWIYKGKKPCIIDFYTTWCGPCKRLAPIMEELSEQYKGKITFYKVDTEQERELAYFFQISSIPQVLYIPAQGDPTLTKGLYPKEEIVKIINEVLLKQKK